MVRSRSMEAAARIGVLGAVLALSSCVADSVSVRVLCNAFPEDNCSYNDEGEVCHPNGAMNLEMLTRNKAGYSAVLRVENGLKSRDTMIPVQAEPNGVQFTELEIELRDRSGSRLDLGSGLPNPYTVSATGFAEPGGLSLLAAELISPVYVQRIAELEFNGAQLGRIQLAIVVRGTTSGQVSVESAEWFWNIDLIVPEAGSQCLLFEDPVCTPGQDGWSRACETQGG